MGGIGPSELIVLAFIVITVVWPFWKIFEKAGFSGWWSLTILIPIIGTIALFYLAFAEWPIQRKHSELKQPPNIK
jgi:hypothetical protein